MERAELDQYRDLCREIKYLEEKIKKMPKEVSIVKGSSPYFPYLERRSRVEGPGREEKALRKVLYQRRARCLEMKHRIYHFIDTIEDSRTRLVFELRYIARKFFSRKCGSKAFCHGLRGYCAACSYKQDMLHVVLFVLCVFNIVCAVYAISAVYANHKHYVL